MPRKSTTRKSTKRKRRGRGIGRWARKGLAAVKQHKLLSRGATLLNAKYGAQALKKISNPVVRNIAGQAINYGISKLKQSGYGLRRSGMGLTRTGGKVHTLARARQAVGDRYRSKLI